MPILEILTPKLKDALGQTGNLVTRYEGLMEKSKSVTLRDNPEATSYVDAVIRRYQIINATCPPAALQEKKELTLTLLKEHAAKISVLSFSKPGDLTSRLKLLDFESDAIDQIVKGLEQAGGDDECLEMLLSTCLVSGATLAACGDRHHHSHP